MWRKHSRAATMPTLIGPGHADYVKVREPLGTGLLGTAPRKTLGLWGEQIFEMYGLEILDLWASITTGGKEVSVFS